MTLPDFRFVLLNLRGTLPLGGVKASVSIHMPVRMPELRMDTSQGESAIGLFRQAKTTSKEQWTLLGALPAVSSP